MIFKRLAALLLLTAQAAATTPEMAAAERAGEPSTTELEERRMQRHAQSLEAKSFRIVRAEQIRGTLRNGLRALRLLTLLVIALLYLDFVLGQFVWTRAFANRLFDIVMGPLTTMGQAIVGHIPNLIFLAFLFVVVRFILRLLRLFFSAIARGSIRLTNFAPEWA